MTRIHIAFLPAFTAILLWLALPAARSAPLPVPPQTFVTAPDGLRLAVQEYGSPQGPEMVLIHGLYGSHLDWQKQVASATLKKYRIITYDLRGHGFSGHPTDPRFYAEGKRWGDDLHAVLAAKHLKRPVLVGWSLGGVVMTNYLQTYGDKNIAGLVYVDGVIELKPGLITLHPEFSAAAVSPDQATYLEGTQRFLRACFYHQPDPQTFTRLYGVAALASPEMVRQLNTSLSVPAATALPQVTVPTLYIYGAKDALVGRQTVTRAKQLLPHLQVKIYPVTGHASFFEQPQTFNRDLDTFAHRAEGQ